MEKWAKLQLLVVGNGIAAARATEMKGRIAEAGLRRQGRGQHVSYWRVFAVPNQVY